MPTDAPADGSTTTGDLIRELRIKRRMTQKLLAEKAGLSVSTISKIETGEVQPQRDTTDRIAAALGVTAGYLDPQAFAADVANRATAPDQRRLIERILAITDPQQRQLIEKMLERLARDQGGK